MKKTLLLYWAPGGNVETTAKAIVKQIGTDKVELCSVASFEPAHLKQFDNLIFGIATIGADVWYDANADNKWNDFFKSLSGTRFTGKKIAIFGLGNQLLYPENFVDSLSYLKEEIVKLDGKLIGAWPTKGYQFTNSLGVEKDMFLGLAIDEDFQPELTSSRISAWIELLQPEMNF